MRDENQALQNALFHLDVSQGLTNETWLHMVASEWKRKMVSCAICCWARGESRGDDWEGDWARESLTLSTLPNSWAAHPPLPSDWKQEEEGSVGFFLSKRKLLRQHFVCWVLPWHCPHWSAFNKDDLIRLAPGIRLNLKPCRYYQNICVWTKNVSGQPLLW